MASTARIRPLWHTLALGFAGLPGCSAAANPDEPLPPAVAQEAPQSGAMESGVLLPAPGSAAPTLPALPAPESSAPPPCVTARAEVELIREPVDIIIALDNSPSMDDEARAVEANLNTNFADILQSSQVDYRVILVSEHRESARSDTAVCIQSPLSSLAACPSEAPGPSDRFFQYSIGIGSSNSFDVLLETYAGEREDDFGVAPGGWSEWLRPGAKKVFLEITDDDENMTATEFASSLVALAPEHFGTDPSQLGFVWHSIVGVASRPIATDPYVPADPLEDRECEGNVANAGTTYQELSRMTGGLRFPICEFDGYDAVFRRIANDVASSSRTACAFAIPAPPPGRALDLDKVAVSFAPGGGAPPQTFGQVQTADTCQEGAFFIEGEVVRLCPAACERATASDLASVDVLFTCQSTLLR